VTVAKGNGGAASGWRSYLPSTGTGAGILREAVPPILAVLLTMAILAVLMLILSASPLEAFGALWRGIFGSRYGVGLMLAYSIPLILAGLSVGIALKTGLFNIGAEGQLQIGGVCALVGALPTGSAVVGLVSGIIGGALWGGIAGALRAWRGVNEIISTMMLNFIAIYAVNNAILGPLCCPEASHPTTHEIPRVARLPLLLEGTRLHAGFIVAIAACILCSLMLRYTSFGFGLRVVGANPRAAAYAGLSAPRCWVLAMLVAGGLAGLAGATEVLGVRYYLALNWSRGWGWPAIAIAFLGRGSPLAIIPIGLFYGFLDAGSLQVQAATGLPAALVQMMQGLPVVLLVAIQSLQAMRTKRRAAGG